MSCGPILTPLRSKAVRRHFFSMSLFGSGNQSFNIAAVAAFLWVIFTIVSCLGNVTVTETAAECYWKSIVKAGLDRHEDHGSLSWFLQENRSPHDSNSRIQKSFARGIRNPGLWNLKFSSRNPESHQRLESGTSPESSTWNPLNYLMRGEIELRVFGNKRMWVLCR